MIFWKQITNRISKMPCYSSFFRVGTCCQPQIMHFKFKNFRQWRKSCSIVFFASLSLWLLQTCSRCSILTASRMPVTISIYGHFTCSLNKGIFYLISDGPINGVTYCLILRKSYLIYWTYCKYRTTIQLRIPKMPFPSSTHNIFENST